MMESAYKAPKEIMVPEKLTEPSLSKKIVRIIIIIIMHGANNIILVGCE